MADTRHKNEKLQISRTRVWVQFKIQTSGDLMSEMWSSRQGDQWRTAWHLWNAFEIQIAILNLRYLYIEYLLKIKSVSCFADLSSALALDSCVKAATRTTTVPRKEPDAATIAPATPSFWIDYCGTLLSTRWTLDSRWWLVHHHNSWLLLHHWLLHHWLLIHCRVRWWLLLHL